MPVTYMNQWKWPSGSNPDIEHTISLTWDGEYQCSCKGWTMHMPRSDCTHIKKLKASPEKLRQGLRFAVAER